MQINIDLEAVKGKLQAAKQRVKDYDVEIFLGLMAAGTVATLAVSTATLLKTNRHANDLKQAALLFGSASRDLSLASFDLESATYQLGDVVYMMANKGKSSQ